MHPRSFFLFFMGSFFLSFVLPCHGRPRWVKTVHDVCGLACILGLTGPNNQVSLTKERSTRWNGDPPDCGNDFVNIYRSLELFPSISCFLLAIFLFGFDVRVELVRFFFNIFSSEYVNLCCVCM